MYHITFRNRPPKNYLVGYKTRASETDGDAPRPAIVDQKHMKHISLNDPQGQGHSFFQIMKITLLT